MTRPTALGEDGPVVFLVAILILLVVAAFAMPLMLAATSSAFGAGADVQGSTELAPLSTPPACPQSGHFTVLEIPTANPVGRIVSGDRVGVTLEFGVTNHTVPVAGIIVRTPTVVATFPLKGGSVFSVTLSNHTFNMTGTPWTSLEYDKLVTADAGFNASKNATLSSQKLSMMADTPYGTLQLEWRWSWNVSFPNGTYNQGPWTVPTSSSKSGVWLPSIFDPAPYVSLLSESPKDETIGSTYTMFLGGDVAGRAFYIEFENSVGAVKAQTWLYDRATTNATFEGNITLLGWGKDFLTPGQYLVHIHDSCLAMLYSKQVTMSYAPSALVNVETTSNCGGLTLNGTVYQSGESATVVPSPNPYEYNFTSCKGSQFANYTYLGAVHSDGDRLLLVVGNGTLELNYRPLGK
jgi:hypothetical protein